VGNVQLRRPEIIDLQLEIFQRLPIGLAEVSLSARRFLAGLIKR
jgi:hypothetical protein